MLILFISTYPPIMCGIASYTNYLTREMPTNGWKVLSFNPHSYGSPVLKEDPLQPEGRVSYSIPNRACDPSLAYNCVNQLSDESDYVVWIQHSFGIWKDTQFFHRILEHLDREGCRLIVTHHTIHFQSNDTPYGLTAKEYELLRYELPHVDAITVSSRHVLGAVARAFPRYKNKIAVIRHGVPLYPDIPVEKAKEQLADYVIFQASPTGGKWKNPLELHDTLLSPHTHIVGDIGFNSKKGSETVFHTGDLLQKRMPDKNIISLHIGTLNEPTDPLHQQRQRLMESFHDGDKKIFLNTYLPEAKLPAALKALDVGLLWRESCTQSGILAHAQGAGATVAGRDLETMGESLRMSGYPACKTYGEFVDSVEIILRNPELGMNGAKTARRYAKKFCWRNQAAKHLQLAEAVLEGAPPSQHMFDGRGDREQR